MGIMGGMHFWWPKISGRLYPEPLAQLAAAITFVGFNLTFFPQFILGFMGNPRRYHIYPAEFETFHVLSSAGSSVLAIGYILPVFYFLWSLKFGAPAGPNPWGAKGLEWETSSPPPPFNFDTIPIVTEEAYNYTPYSEIEAEHDREIMPGVPAALEDEAAQTPTNMGVGDGK
jgi:cytochrome c oxidase subunit 1